MFRCHNLFNRSLHITTAINRSKNMSGYSAEVLNDQTKHHWSVKLFDRENGLADRNAHFGPHKARLVEFKKQNPGAIGE